MSPDWVDRWRGGMALAPGDAIESTLALNAIRVLIRSIPIGFVVCDVTAPSGAQKYSEEIR